MPADPLRAFAVSLARFAGGARMARLTLLFVVTGLTDGAGLFLLVPILEVLASPGGGRSGITRAVVALGVPPTLSGLLAAFVLVVALRAVVLRLRDVATHALLLEFVDDIRARLLHGVAGASWPFLARRRLSDVAHAFSSDVVRIMGATYFALKLPSLLVLVLVQAAVAVRIAPPLALGTLAGSALLGLALRGQLRRVHELGRETSAAQRDIFHDMSEFLAGMKLAKSSAAEERHVAACVAAARELRGSQLGFVRANAASSMVFQVGAAAAMALLVYLGAAVARLPLPELMVLGAVFARLLPIVLDGLHKLQDLVHSLPAHAAVEALIADCERHAERDDGAEAPALRSELRFEDVSLRYDAGGPDVLHGLSLVIPAGRMIAVTGPSGAGKSTLADVAMGLLEPTRGRVTIDGVPLAPGNARAWRRSIAYVPQECFLFRQSVRANLLWARPDAGEREMWSALSVAAADGFVAALPQGLDTVIGDRGLRLSGGERQRLALARAVLRRPQMLVLDEATSALDAENERLVQAAIERLRGLTTILVIAHRLTTIRAADEIVVLMDGRIAERGAWQDLALRRDGWLAAALTAPNRAAQPSAAG